MQQLFQGKSILKLLDIKLILKLLDIKLILILYLLEQFSLTLYEPQHYQIKVILNLVDMNLS